MPEFRAPPQDATIAAAAAPANPGGAAPLPDRARAPAAPPLAAVPPTPSGGPPPPLPPASGKAAGLLPVAVGAGLAAETILRPSDAPILSGNSVLLPAPASSFTAETRATAALAPHQVPSEEGIPATPGASDSTETTAPGRVPPPPPPRVVSGAPAAQVPAFASPPAGAGDTPVPAAAPAAAPEPRFAPPASAVTAAESRLAYLILQSDPVQPDPGRSNLAPLGLAGLSPTLINAPDSPAAPAVLLPATVQQIIAALPAAETGAIALALAPEELGQICLTLQPDGDSLRIVLQAERGDTMDLLRRNGDALLQEMRAAGFADATLSFGDRGGGGRQRAGQGETAATAPPPPPPTPPPAAVATGGLDLRI